MNIRKPRFAGQFYPADKDEMNHLINLILSNEISHIDGDLAGSNLIGAVVPHAGYVYSGYEAVHVFEILSRSETRPDTVIILHPNHNAYGPDVALDVNDVWESPLGTVGIDREFSALLNLPAAEEAHFYEHSGEVMLPFLQYFLSEGFRILPVSMLRQSARTARKLAEVIYNTNKKLRRRLFVIASSDFSHFVDPDEGRKLDDMVLKHILEFNPERIEESVVRNRISVCGYGPIMTLLYFAGFVNRHPGLKVLRRGNSGEIMDSSEVVDYISIMVYS